MAGSNFILRTTKGSELTFQELDGNQSVLLESASTAYRSSSISGTTLKLFSVSFTGSVTPITHSVTILSSSYAESASYAISSSHEIVTEVLSETASFFAEGVVTASADNNVITFTKDDSSTFTITVATGSGYNNYISDVSFGGTNLAFSGSYPAFTGSVNISSVVSAGRVANALTASSALSTEYKGKILKNIGVNDITASFYDSSSVELNRLKLFYNQSSSFHELTIDTGSGGGGSTDYISNVTFAAGDLTFTGQGSAFSSTVDLGDLVSGSVLRPEGDNVVSGSVLRPTGDDVVSGSVLRPEGDNVVSGSLQIADITGSVITGAAINGDDGRKIDFTKGDNTTFSVTVDTGSGGGGGDGYVSNVTFAAGDLSFTGEGSAFNSTVDLGDIVSGSVLRPEGDDVVSGSVLRPTGDGVFSSSAQPVLTVGHVPFIGQGFGTDLDTPLTTGFNLQAGYGTYIRKNGNSFFIDSGILQTDGDGNAISSSIISESAQIDHDATTNFVAEEHFLQSDITTVGTVTTGDVTAILPDLIVSGSASDVRTFLNVEDGADVTDTANVTTAGALMDSEVTSLALIKGLTAAEISGSGDVRFKAINDATSSYLLNTTDTLTGDLTVTGTLTTNEIVSNIVSQSITLSTGSNTFGDQSSDKHEFTGSVDVQGDVTAHDYYGGWQGQVISASKVDIDVSGYIDGSGAANEFARFTDSNTLEGLTAAQTRNALNVEDGATADQTNAEIRAAVEAATDSNVFTDDDHTKLNGIEAGADVTDATNVKANLPAGVPSGSAAQARAQIGAGTGDGDGTVTEVTVGTGLDVADGTTTPNITLDLSELTDMTAAVVGSQDELILLDNGAERRKLIQEITLSDFNNDSGWTSNTGTVDTSGTPVDNDYAKFTDSNTVEGRSYSEVRSDLGLGTIYNKNSTTSVTNGSTDIPDGNAVYDHVTTRLSGYVNKTGTPANQQIAIFTDSDTISGSTQLKMSTSAGAQGLVVGDDGKANLYLGNVISAATSDVGSRFHMNNQDFYFDFQGDSTQTLFFRDYDGSGGIHTRAQIHFNGALSGYVEAAGGFTTGGNISGSAGLFSGDVTANNFITTSDRDLKSNITPIKEGLETLKKFVSYEYDLKGQKDAGFIAQEVQETLPYAVHKSKDGYLAMNTKPIVAHIHKAILELDKRLTDIEDKLK